MKNVVAKVLLMTMLAISPLQQSFAQGQSYISQITIFAGNFAPRGWAYCEGQLLPIAQYDQLFKVIGTKYGGDGKTTFALPNLKEAEKALGGARYIIAIQGLYPPP